MLSATPRGVPAGGDLRRPGRFGGCYPTGRVCGTRPRGSEMAASGLGTLGLMGVFLVFGVGGIEMGSEQDEKPFRSAENPGAAVGEPRSAMGFRPPSRLLLPFAPRDCISVRRTAEMLDCGLTTVLRLIERRDIDAYQLYPGKAGSPWRIRFESVITYLRKLHREAGIEPRFDPPTDEPGAHRPTSFDHARK